MEEKEKLGSPVCARCARELGGIAAMIEVGGHPRQPGEGCSLCGERAPLPPVRSEAAPRPRGNPQNYTQFLGRLNDLPVQTAHCFYCGASLKITELRDPQYPECQDDRHSEEKAERAAEAAALAERYRQERAANPPPSGGGSIRHRMTDDERYAAQRREWGNSRVGRR